MKNLARATSGPRGGILALAGLLAAAAPAATADSLEYTVKAAFLLNFARFAQWPPASPQATSADVAICVLGEDPFGSVLDETMSGRAVGGRSIVVRRHLAAHELGGCHVLFVSRSETGHLDDLLSSLGRAPVLTVGESSDFLERGGVARLLLRNDRVRFEVRLEPCEGAGLRLSSRLLSLAEAVHVGSR